MDNNMDYIYRPEIKIGLTFNETCELLEKDSSIEKYGVD